MKIRELGLIKRSDIKKLWKYADFTVEEFVDSIDKALKKGEHIHKFYFELYKELHPVPKEGEKDESEESTEPKEEIITKEDEEVIEEEQDSKEENKTFNLKEIPLSHIQF